MFRRSKINRTPFGDVKQVNYWRLEKRQLLAADLSSEPIDLAFVENDPVEQYVEVQWNNETLLARGDRWLIWDGESDNASSSESNGGFRTVSANTLAVGDEYLLSDSFTANATTATATSSIAAAQKLEVVDEISSGLFLLSGSENFSYELVAQSVADWMPNAIVEPDFIVSIDAIPDDPSFSGQWGLHNTGQTGGVVDADIDAVEAWDITTGSSDVVVGVIDTGIDYTHPDLVDNMWVNPGEIADDGIDNDGNGYIDDVYGWDFVNNDNDPFDDEGHGTHVAGTIGASGNNGLGVTGVTQNVSLMALKFLSRSGSGSTSDAIRAIEYTNTMKELGTNLVLTNNSWGGGDYSSAMANVIEDALDLDILFVAAAGNDSSSYTSYPAGHSADNIISVASTDHDDELSYFSNYGTNWVDLAAPGSSILSTRAGGGYETLSGTSMASPHVAGALALLSAARPELTALQLKEQLLDNVDVLPQLATRVASSGRLNVHSMFDVSVAFDAETYLADGMIGVDLFDASGFVPGETVTFESSSGDTETVAITATGATQFFVSIQAAPGTVNSNDGVLQVADADIITVTYVLSSGTPVTDSATMVTDDHGDDAGSATVLNAPFSVAGSVDIPGDKDWFSFTAVAGWKYEFEISVDSLSASKLSFYDTDGLTLLEQSNAPAISWVAPQWGTFYASVEHGFGTGIGSYQLTGYVPASTVEFDSPNFGTPGIVGFDVFDATGFASGATVSIVSSSGDLETLPIAGASFDFSASINSLEGLASHNDGVLQVTSGDTLTVVYLDSEDGNGGSVTNADTAAIYADDHGNEFGLATPLSVPHNLSGAIETFGDEDWFSFSAVTGFQYEFEVAFDDLSGSELNLYDIDGITRLESASFASNISWVAPASGTYYLSYEGLNADEAGNYQLTGFSTVPESSIEFTEVGYYAPGTVSFTVADATGFSVGSTLLLETSSGDTETIQISPGFEFSSSIGSAGGAASPNDGVLQVTSDDTLTATYVDSDGGLGETFTATNTTKIFVDDHGNSPLTATSLTIPASVSGSIEIAEDQDWFSFDAVAGTTYRFEVPTHDEYSRLALYGIDGTTRIDYDSISPIIFWSASSGGTYFLSVENYYSEDIGSYELTASIVIDDHGDDAATASFLSFPADVSGSIEIAGDQDWFRFNAVAGATYRFGIPTHDNSPDLILYDTNGITQLERDYFSDPSILWDAPSDGTYYLAVKKYSSYNYGNYELTAERIVDDHGDDATTATTIDLQENIFGSIDVEDDQDWFRFVASAGTTYEFEIPVHDEYIELFLFDTNGTTQLERDYLSQPSFIWNAPSHGAYYLSVENYYDDPGTYELSAKALIDDHGNSAAAATELVLTTNVSGSIELAGDQDWFSFSAVAGENFVFEIPAAENYTDLILYGIDGATELEREYLTAPTISWAAPGDGTYYLSVENYYSSATGTYELSTTRIVDDHGDSFVSATLLSLPASISGAIEVPNDQDWFSFNAVVGTAYRFAIPTYDEYTELTLYGTNGTTQLEQENWVDPAIFWIAPSSGAYYLSVESYYSDDFGDYELSVTSHFDIFGDSFTAATPLTLPANIPSAIETEGDEDWFRFNAVAGGTYRFELPVADDYGELILFDTDGTTQLERDYFSSPSILWVAPSSGSYYLAVTNYYDYEVGGYELTASLIIDDHGDGAAAATALGLPANISGSIEIEGDQDWFSFTASAGEKFKFEIPTSDEYIELTLFDTDGTTQLEQGSISTTSIFWVAPNDGTFYLSIETYFSTRVSDYELSAVLLPDDHGDRAEIATLLPFPANVSGSFESFDDQDWFQFIATAGEKFEFAVPVSDEYVELKLYDTDGTTQLERDIFDAPVITWSAPSDGTYYLSVEDYYGTRIGNYELTASKVDDDHGDYAATATPFSVASGLTGSVETESDRDWFQFDATAGLAYDFTLQWDGPRYGELSLVDTDGSTVLVNDAYSPNFSWDALESGTYFLVVEGAFRTYLGDYELIGSSALLETAVAFDASAYLTPNNVTIDLVDGTGFSPGATLTIESSSGDSETLVITSTGVQLSTTLGTAEALANPDDGTLQITSGDRLVATYFDANQGLGGRFFLETASVFVDDHGDRPDTATFVDFPSTTSGVIEIDSDGDWFRFPAVAGLEYVFETNLDSLTRSTLTLFDTDGTTLLSSDSSAAGSQISWLAPATGQYYLEVQSYGSVYSDAYQLNASISATLSIEDVIVSSTQFASEFIDVVNGNGLGYSLVGEHQLESLPWMNIDTFYLQFSEDVSASLSADDVQLTGTDGGTYGLVLAGYDTASNTAEFRIDRTVNTESFVISIFEDSVTNPLGVTLDGEWATGQTAPSGNDTQGGQFDFFFNVLVGDEDGSGQVNSVDAFDVMASNTEATNQSNFRRDFDGSGQINSIDAFAAFANSANGLLASPTAPIAPASSTISTDSVDDHGNDSSSATAISIPLNLSGTFESFGDEDWFSFNAVAGHQYEFGTPIDYAIELSVHDTDGLTLLQTSGYYSEISWLAPASGTYYLKLQHRYDSAPSNYHLLGSATISSSTIQFDANNYYTTGVVGVEIKDATGFVPGASVLFESSSGDSETVLISSSGLVTSSSISTAEGIVNPNDGVLQVALDDTVTATYLDLDDGFGSTLTATDRATIVPDDHGDDAATATLLALPSSVSGSIEVLGNRDWFRFNAVGGMTHRFELPSYSDLDLILYDTDGTTQLQQSFLDSPFIAWDAPSDGVYYLSVGSFDSSETGAFQLSSQVYVDDYGNDPASATSLGIPGSLTGSIDFGADQDWFTFTANAGTILEIEIPSYDNPPEIILYDIDGTTQLARDTSSSPSMAIKLPSDGAYYLSIENYSSSSCACVVDDGSDVGNYTISITEIEDVDGDDAASATTFDFPTSVSSTIDFVGDVDWFRFNGVAGEIYIFEASVNNQHEFVLYDSDGIAQLAQDTSYDPSFTVKMPNDGVYYLSIENRSSSDATTYTLSFVEIEDSHGDDATSATALDFPASVLSSIEITGDSDWFRFNAIAGTTYAFHALVNDGHELTLYDTDGTTPLELGDSSSPSIVWDAALDGIYYLSVTNDFIDGIGNWDYQLTAAVDDHGGDAVSATGIETPADFTGFIDFAGDQDWFSFTASAGTRFQFNIPFQDERPTLTLYDTDGTTQLLQSDNYYATIQWDAPTDGVYYLSVEQSSPSDIGRYGLSTVILPYEHGDEPATATMLDLPASVPGAIDTSYDEDWFSFNAAAGERFEFEIPIHRNYTKLALYDTDGTTELVNDLYHRHSKILWVAPSEGTYFLSVDFYIYNTGRYELLAKSITDEHGDDFTVATQIELPANISSSIDYPNEEDWFSFNATNGTAYEFTIPVGGGYSSVYIYDSDGTTQLRYGDRILWIAPSDGTYYFSIETSFSSNYGNYEVSAAPLIDVHGDNAATATPISIPASIFSSIDFLADQDWFRFDAVVGTTYRFEVPNSEENNVKTSVYDTDGVTPLENVYVSSRSIFWVAPSDGTYFLSVDYYQSQDIGNYELTAMPVLDDHGNDTSTATPLSLPEVVSGSIGIAGDHDWFSFNVTANSKIAIETPSANTTTKIALYGSDGTTLVSQDDNYLPSISWFSSTGGTYYLSVEASSSAGFGDYELSVALLPDDHGDNTVTATSIELSSSVLGSLETEDDVDWFRFTASAFESFEFELPQTEFNTYLIIHRSNGGHLGSNDGYRSSISWVAPSDGTYFLSVKSYQSYNVGDYTLSATHVGQSPDDHGDDAATSSLLNFPTLISGSIGIVGDEDWFRFDAEAAKTYRFSTPTATETARLRIFDADGTTQLANGQSTFLLTWVAPSDGTYYFSIEQWFNSSVLEYELSTEIITDDHGDDAANATPLDLTTRVSGTIDIRGDEDWFSFAATAGEDFHFSLPSHDDPARLTLYSTNGTTQLELEAHSALSILWFAPSSGTYYLSVKGWQGSEIFDYSLSARPIVDDHGNDSSRATLLDLPANISGNLELVEDEDWLRFDAVAGEEFHFAASFHDERGILSVYDSDGRTELLSDSDGTSSTYWTAPRTGSFYLSVKTALDYRTSTYSLTARSIADDYGDDAATATSLDLPASIPAALEFPGDSDWFRFNALAGEQLLFETADHDSSIRLRVHGTDGAAELTQGFSYLSWTVPSDGAYYLSVEFSTGAATRDYGIVASVVVDNHGDDSATSTLLQVPSYVSDSIGVPGDQDWFHFDAFANMAYEFELEWDGLGYAELSLLDTDGSTVLASDWRYPNISWNAPKSGTFYLVVEAVEIDDFGDYQLNTFSALQETRINFNKYAYLTGNPVTIDLFDPTGFAQGATITLESSSGDFETIAITSTGLDSATSFVTANASVSPNDGILQVAPEDRLVATYFDPDRALGGKYFIDSVSVYGDDHGGDANTATHVDFPATTSGSLLIDDDESDWFAFSATAGFDYFFEVILAEHGDLYESSVTLYDTDGVTALASDNTSSVFPIEGAQISWQAPSTGQYYLAVGSSDYLIYHLAGSNSSTAPVIEDVIVSSTQFADSFINVIGDENGLGYSLVGNHQLESLPWMNIDTFYLQFSENVSASLSSNDVLLSGMGGGTYDLEFVAYESLSNTAEFRINDPINTDRLVLSVIDRSVTNPLGVMLDGNWTTGQTDPSGNGTQGGQFDFFFNVLVGDEDNSGHVSSVDAFNVGASNTAATDQENSRKDIDGNGQINSSDAFAAFANNTVGLPDPTTSTAPVITDVIVGSTQFSNDFVDVIGAANGLGYSLVGEHQLGSLPWMNIDTFYLQFSDDVAASLSASDVALTDNNGGTYELELAGYNASSNMAEFRIDGSLSTASFFVSILDGSVTNLSGDMLDADWASGQTGPSGNGIQGGQFDFLFNVIVGDEDGSGQVNSADVFNVIGSNTEATNSSNFRRDIDGSGQINSIDALAAFANSTNGLPIAAATQLPLQTSPAMQVTAVDRDSFFSEAPTPLAIWDTNVDPNIPESYPIDLADLSEEDKKRRQLFEAEEELAMVDSL